jgi:hypothetical protein
MKPGNCFLLLQFILEELFLCHQICQTNTQELLPSCNPPSPLSLAVFTQDAPIDRLQEHTRLLSLAFPGKNQEIKIFLHALSNTTNLLYNCQSKRMLKKYTLQISVYFRQMFFLLEPFFEECKNEGSFLFFLLSHQQEIGLLSHPRHLSSLLRKWHPKGLGSLQEHLCNHFYKKGFSYLIPEIKSLMQSLKQGMGA